jgi:hypothetical protein
MLNKSSNNILVKNVIFGFNVPTINQEICLENFVMIEDVNVYLMIINKSLLAKSEILLFSMLIGTISVTITL